MSKLPTKYMIPIEKMIPISDQGDLGMGFAYAGEIVHDLTFNEIFKED
jgi:hypothetical protein